MKKMEKVIKHLDAIAKILGENIPIVFLPLMEHKDGRGDPLKGSSAFIVRDKEYMKELNELYDTGRIDYDPRESTIQ